MQTKENLIKKLDPNRSDYCDVPSCPNKRYVFHSGGGSRLCKIHYTDWNNKQPIMNGTGMSMFNKYVKAAEKELK